MGNSQPYCGRIMIRITSVCQFRRFFWRRPGDSASFTKNPYESPKHCEEKLACVKSRKLMSASEIDRNSGPRRSRRLSKKTMAPLISDWSGVRRRGSAACRAPRQVDLAHRKGVKVPVGNARTITFYFYRDDLSTNWARRPVGAGNGNRLQTFRNQKHRPRRRRALHRTHYFEAAPGRSLLAWPPAPRCNSVSSSNRGPPPNCPSKAAFVGRQRAKPR